MKNKKALIIIAIILVLIDQIAKILMLNMDFVLINQNGFGLRLEQNPSTDNNIAYILISGIAIYLILKYMKSNNSFIKFSNRIVLDFALAGAISNLIDRIWLGHVINYISIPFFTNMNLGYFYIIITWIGLAAVLTKYTMNNMKKRKKK